MSARRLSWTPLLALGLVACAGSEFHVTSRNEAIGRAEPRSCEAAGWTTHASARGLFELQHPEDWEVVSDERGRYVVEHPDGSMVLEASAAWLPGAVEKVPHIKAQRFAESELLSPWTRRARPDGYLLEGILREGNQIVIARYLVKEDRYAEATLRSSLAFDDACRKVAVKSISSLALNDAPRPGETSERDVEAEAEAATPPATPDEPPLEAGASAAAEASAPAPTPASTPEPQPDPQPEPQPEPQPKPQQNPAAGEADTAPAALDLRARPKAADETTLR